MSPKHLLIAWHHRILPTEEVGAYSRTNLVRAKIEHTRQSKWRGPCPKEISILVPFRHERGCYMQEDSIEITCREQALATPRNLDELFR